jgi:hypothetical protein
MKLTLGTATETSTTLYLDEDDTVIVQSADPEVARKIARAVNRDDQFEALVAALTPFRSSEMGGLLVSMIDIRQPKAKEAEKQLSMLINFIDVILNTVEMRSELNEYDDANAA